MWYVNKCGKNIYESEKLCFILTMWYVNIEYVDYVMVDGDGFILTMWYVNNLTDKELGNIIQVLY